MCLAGPLCCGLHTTTITLPLVTCSRADFAVGPVFAELAKFSAAAKEGTDAPGIRPEVLEAMLAALDSNKAVHATR
eukprot:COSAG02_NODE_1722_length_11193_cov_39.876600_10_plen_76_part_00